MRFILNLKSKTNQFTIFFGRIFRRNFWQIILEYFLTIFLTNSFDKFFEEFFDEFFGEFFDEFTVLVSNEIIPRSNIWQLTLQTPAHAHARVMSIGCFYIYACFFPAWLVITLKEVRRTLSLAQKSKSKKIMTREWYSSTLCGCTSFSLLWCCNSEEGIVVKQILNRFDLVNRVIFLSHMGKVWQ